MKFINCTNDLPFIFINAHDSIQFDGCIIKDSGGNNEFITSRKNSGTISVKDSIFSGGYNNRGLISADRTNLIVENCTFENLSAVIGAAINFKGYKLTVRNSKFLNLNAETTGGAIIAKFFPKNDTKIGDAFLIENCEFINTTSSNNGGAKTPV